MNWKSFFFNLWETYTHKHSFHLLILFPKWFQWPGLAGSNEPPPASLQVQVTKKLTGEAHQPFHSQPWTSTSDLYHCNVAWAAFTFLLMESKKVLLLRYTHVPMCINSLFLWISEQQCMKTLKCMNMLQRVNMFLHVAIVCSFFPWSDIPICEYSKIVLFLGIGAVSNFSY